MFSLLEKNKHLLNKKPRNPCVCGVKTSLLCKHCFAVNICKTHKICETCSLTVYNEKKMLLELSADEQKKEEGRKKARDAYRIKMGIPTDLPLLPRGGARNCKNYTEDVLAEKAEALKKYQAEYQKMYRKKKSIVALQKKTLELMDKQATLIKTLQADGHSATNEIEMYKGFEQYFMLLSE